MTVLLIFVVLNCSMARYNGRLRCIVGVLPTCYKRKAATYFYPPGGTGRCTWEVLAKATEKRERKRGRQRETVVDPLRFLLCTVFRFLIACALNSTC